MNNYKNIKKLGVGIVAFDATEHLASVISEYRDLVDYIVVGLQKYSYTGDTIDSSDVAEVEQLKEEGLVDRIIYVDTDRTKFSRVQETVKRNALIDDIKKHGCSHCLIQDSDEFYTHNSFERALNDIDEHDYAITYCRYVNYYHDYTHYCVYPFKNGNWVPFVARTDYKFAWQCYDYPNPSDPTRRYVRPKVYQRDPKSGKIRTKKVAGADGKSSYIPLIDHYLVDYHEFKWNELKMHHLSWLRADIRKKLNDWSSKPYFHNVWEIIDRAVYGFDNATDDSKTATILFNTPGQQIDISTFKKQFIFPKYDYKYRVHNLPNHHEFKTIDMTDLNFREVVRAMKEIADSKEDDRPLFDYCVLFTRQRPMTDDLRDQLQKFIDMLRDDSVVYSDIVDKRFDDDPSQGVPYGNIIIISRQVAEKLSAYYSSQVGDSKDVGRMIGLTLMRYADKIRTDYGKYISEFNIR